MSQWAVHSTSLEAALHLMMCSSGIIEFDTWSMHIAPSREDEMTLLRTDSTTSKLRRGMKRM